MYFLQKIIFDAIISKFVLPGIYPINPPLGQKSCLMILATQFLKMSCSVF